MRARTSRPRGAAVAADRPLSLVEVLKRSASWLAERGLESPRLEAELLLAHGLGLRRLDLYLQHDRPISEAERTALRVIGWTFLALAAYIGVEALRALLTRTPPQASALGIAIAALIPEGGVLSSTLPQWIGSSPSAPKT